MISNYSKNRLMLVISIGVVFFFGIAVYSGATQTINAETTPIAVGTIEHSELFNGPATVTVRQLKIAPGEVLAWHHHPGRAYNVIKSGTLTVEDGCGGEETLTAGEAFEEVIGRVHRAKNLGAEDVVVINTFIVPQGSPTTINTPNNQRLCGPPVSVEECKKGGWMNFTHPRTFSGRGDCIQFVITGK
ncbi:MAG TPA: cupin domain-containing protein [Blastocatellia bacterium]|nr:cupin domain-containing protein [Blastocatellia bacterium]